MKRIILLCGLALLPLAGGCRFDNAPAPGQSTPFAGVAFSVSIPSGSGLAEAWQSLLIEWSARTGAEVTVVERPLHGGSGDHPAAGDDPTAEASPAALVVFPASELGALVADGALASIPSDELGDESLAWNDVLPGAAAVSSVERRPTAVPIACPTLVLYCRGDLLESAGLSAPRTWDDYRRLLESLDRWAPGLTAVEPWGPGSRGAMFLARAAPLARHPGDHSLFFDIDTGDPALDSPAFAKALDAARADVARMPADVRRLSPSECRRELIAGRAAMAVGWETPRIAGGDADRSPRGEATQVTIVRLPGSRSVYDRTLGRFEEVKGGEPNRAGLVGFAGLSAGVSSRAGPREAQAAWNLLAVLLSPDNAGAAFPGALRSPVRLSYGATPAEITGFDLTDREAGEYVAAVEQTLRDSRLVAALPVPGHDSFLQSLEKGLERALSGNDPSEAILNDVQAEWESLVKSIGRERVRDTYRRMLGLTAAPSGR